MTDVHLRSERQRVLAACAVALATAVGGSVVGSEADASTLEQLQRYCVSSWRHAGIRRQDWDDCTQQALLELVALLPQDGLSTAVHDRASHERRELNRAVWRLVQRCRRAPKHDSFDERQPPTHRASHPLSSSNHSDADRDWEAVMQAAAEVLSDRQLEILQLSREGWRAAEIAERIGISAQRVSDEKYKAITKVRERLET